jgi:hypothetical protein
VDAADIGGGAGEREVVRVACDDILDEVDLLVPGAIFPVMWLSKESGL